MTDVDVTVRPLHEAVGAEIEGVDPSELLTDGVLAQLRDIFDEHSVLVFRDLDIDEKGQRALVFALIHEDPAAYDDMSTKKTLRVSNRSEDSAAPYGRLLFHCDNMWARTPQFALSLYGEHVESPSAPTQFASMVAGWESLPHDLKQRVAGLEARHGFEGKYPNRGGDDDVTDSDFGVSRSVVRPLVRGSIRGPARRCCTCRSRRRSRSSACTRRRTKRCSRQLFAHL